MFFAVWTLILLWGDTDWFKHPKEMDKIEGFSTEETCNVAGARYLKASESEGNLKYVCVEIK